MSTQIKDIMKQQLRSDRIAKKAAIGLQIRGFLSQSGYNPQLLEDVRRSLNSSFEKQELSLSCFRDKIIQLKDAKRRVKNPKERMSLENKEMSLENKEIRGQSLSQELPTYLIKDGNKTSNLFLNTSKFLFGQHQTGLLNSPSSQTTSFLPQQQIIGKSMLSQTSKIHFPQHHSEVPIIPRKELPKSHIQNVAQRTKGFKSSIPEEKQEVRQASPFQDRLLSPSSTHSLLPRFNNDELKKNLVESSKKNKVKKTIPKLEEQSSGKKQDRRISNSLDKLPAQISNDKSQKVIYYTKSDSLERVTKNQISHSKSSRLLNSLDGKEDFKMKHNSIQSSDSKYMLSRFDHLKASVLYSIASQAEWLIERLEDLNPNHSISIKNFANFIVDIAHQAIITIQLQANTSSSQINMNDQSYNTHNNSINMNASSFPLLGSGNSSSHSNLMTNSSNFQNSNLLNFKLSDEIISKLHRILSESITQSCNSPQSQNVLNAFENICKNKYNDSFTNQLSKELTPKIKQNILINTLSYLDTTPSSVSHEKLKELKSEIENCWEAILREDSQKVQMSIRANDVRNKVNFTDFFLLKLSLIGALNNEVSLDSKARCSIIKKFEKIRVFIFPQNLFGSNELMIRFKEAIFKNLKCQFLFKEPENSFGSTSQNFIRESQSYTNQYSDRNLNVTNSTNFLNQSKSTQSNFPIQGSNDLEKLSPIRKKQQVPSLHLQSIAQGMISSLSGKKTLFSLLSCLQRHSHQSQSSEAVKECTDVIKDVMYETLNKMYDTSPTLQLKDLEFKMLFLQHIGDLATLEKYFSEVPPLMNFFRKWIADKLSLQIYPENQLFLSSDSPYFLFLEFLIVSLSSREELYSVYDIEAAKKYFKIESQNFKIILNELAFFLLQSKYQKQHIKLLILYLQKTSLVL